MATKTQISKFWLKALLLIYNILLQWHKKLKLKILRTEAFILTLKSSQPQKEVVDCKKSY